MRIHSNTLTESDLRSALNGALDKAPGIEMIVQGRHGSRSHQQAFEMALRGHDKRHTRRPNTGITGGNSSEYAATYDDWGWFLAGVFSLDEKAVCGPYKGRDDFDRQTKRAYIL